MEHKASGDLELPSERSLPSDYLHPITSKPGEHHTYQTPQTFKPLPSDSQEPNSEYCQLAEDSNPAQEGNPYEELPDVADDPNNSQTNNSRQPSPDLSLSAVPLEATEEKPGIIKLINGMGCLANGQDKQVLEPPVPVKVSDKWKRVAVILVFVVLILLFAVIAITTVQIGQNDLVDTSGGKILVYHYSGFINLSIYLFLICLKN